MIAAFASPQDVLSFWRHAGAERWWAKDDAFDTVIRTRFQALWEAARDGKLASWQATDEGALALIIVLDQFPRNMFRGTPEMFSTDAKAAAVAERAITEGRDARIDNLLLQFLYMPFMHIETEAGQARSIELFAKLGDANNLKFAKEHADIVKRFGRFPHRNQTLGRETTPDEAKFLKDGGFAG